MKDHRLLMTAAVVGLAAALVVVPSLSAAQTPPMGGGYTNVIAIPVPENDPQVRLSRRRYLSLRAQGRSRRSFT